MLPRATLRLTTSGCLNLVDFTNMKYEWRAVARRGHTRAGGVATRAVHNPRLGCIRTLPAISSMWRRGGDNTQIVRRDTSEDTRVHRLQQNDPNVVVRGSTENKGQKGVIEQTANPVARA